MAGLWDYSKKNNASIWGGDGGKSVYESYGGKFEGDSEEERKKQEREARKKADEEKKKKEAEQNPLEKVGSFLGGVGKTIAAETEQGFAQVADVALKGGSLVNEAANQIAGGSEQDKNRRREEDLKRTEAVRNWIKGGKDLNGENFRGTSDDIGIQDLNDPQKVARLAGESINVGLAATTFMNPAQMARAGAKGAVKSGLSLAPKAPSAFKQIAKESALYGGLDAAATTSQTYGETGDPLKAAVEGLKAGAGSALFQGALSSAFLGVGKLRSRGKTTAIDPTTSINVSDDIVNEVRQKNKTLLTFDDGKTAKSKPLTAYVADVDRRLSEVDTPEYQKNNGLMNTEAAKARYDEIMSDTENIPGIQEASKAVSDADTQIEYYNNIRTSDPHFRKVDAVKAKIDKIEAARQEDIAYLQQMGENGDVHPEGVASEVGRINKEYDARVKAEQAKIDELNARNPAKAQEMQVLDQAEQTVHTQKMDAQEALDNVAANQQKVATEEAQKIADTPNEEAIAQHKQYLETKKKQLEDRIERAKVRADNPNENLAHTTEELDSIKDGSHPLVVAGASKDRLDNKVLELSEENQVNSAKAIAKDVGEKERVPTDAEVEDMATGVVNEYLDEAILKDKPKLQNVVNFLQQPTQYLRRMGLDKLADLRTDAMIEYSRFQARHEDKLTDYVKAARGSNKDQIFKALDGDQESYAKLSAVGQKVVDDMRKDYREIGIKLGIPEEYIDSVDYAPHLFRKDGSKSELLRLQIELAKARDAIDNGVDPVEAADVRNNVGTAADDIITSEDMSGILETYKKRFDDDNIALRRPNRREDGSLGNYRPKDDYISLLEGRADEKTFNHETVHKAIHQFLQDDEIETLYRDIVKTHGGKRSITKMYREGGYPNIDWRGAAEEEIANTFNDFLELRSSLSKKNPLDHIANWAAERNLPQSVVDILVGLSMKLDKFTGITKSKNRLNQFYRTLESGGFNGAERRTEAYVAPKDVDVRIKQGVGEALMGTGIRAIKTPHLPTSFGEKLHEAGMKIKYAGTPDDIRSQKAPLEGQALGLKEKRVKELQARIDALIDPNQKVQFQDFTKATGNVKNRFLEERKGAEGYETNPFKAYMAYMDAANRKVNFEPFMQQAAVVSNNLSHNSTLARFLREEIRNMSGQKHDWDKFLDDGYNNFLDSKGLNESMVGDYLRNGPTKVLKGFRLTTSMAHLGLSINTAINTTAQGVFMPGSFGFDGTAVGMYRGTQLIGKLAKSKLTKEDVVDFKKMKEMGIMEGTSRIIPEAYENPGVGKANSLLNHGMKGIYAGVIGADRSLRIASYYGAKHIGEQKGLSGKALDRYVYEKVIETNQNFNKYEAPQAWRTNMAKVLGSMVNFVPGAVIRSSEIFGDGVKGAGTIIGKYRGKDVTKGEFYDAVRGVSNAVAFTMTAAVAAKAYENITGQGEVIPNPFSKDFYSSPSMQFITGNDATGAAGLTGLFAGRGDEIDENGNNVSLAERQDKFFNETLPQYFIPGYSQWKRTTNAIKVNEQGYSETAKGNIRYTTDPKNDAQRLLTGEYSTPEGRDYINNMGKPGGGALNGDQSDMVKYGTDSPEQQKMYYDFYKAADKITSRTEANKQVTDLFKAGRPEAARKKATEYNQQVEEKLADWKSNYDYLDDDTLNELAKGLRIELTARSEAARTS